MSSTRPFFRPLALLLLLLALLACTRIDENDSELRDTDGMPDQTFKDGRLWLYNKELVLGSLEAQVIEQYEQETRLRLYGKVKVVDLDSLGRVSTTLTCDTLHFYRLRRDFVAIGNVEVHSEPSSGRLKGDQGPLRLNTTQLEWSNRLARIHTDREVRFETAQDTLYGVGFSSNKDLTSWEISRPSGVSHRELQQEKPR